ncbi:MAG: discoidin domain-containing protein [Ginsengibacter sp.]
MKSSFTLFIIILIATIGNTGSAQTVGAIRWDAWTGTSNFIGQQVEADLSPNKYHYRVPYYGTEVSTDSVTINACTQAIMDQEIQYAAGAGLNYWAFVWYPASGGLDQSRKLYKSSGHIQSINYCLIIEPNNWITNISLDSIVNDFKSPTYQKVLGNRPLLYLLGYAGILKTDVDALRAKTIGAGLGTPYIVEMRVDGVYTTLSTLGLDAFSMYATTWLTNGVSYDSLANTDIAQWNWIGISNKLPFVPNVTTGWDTRPRHDHVLSFVPDPGPDSWVQTATPAQIAHHIVDAKNWNAANPSVAVANTVIVYAWNEFDEGGYICPNITVGNYTIPYTARLDSIAKVLLAPPPVNLALNKTYTSSSQWDNTQTAAKAFDGNFSTDWQAKSGSKFSSQWLKVYFTNNTVFNKVILSEYGNRTTGYKIQYSSNGSSWSTAYTGTTIGTSKTVSFPAVTGKYARILFTSGNFTPIIYEFQIYYDVTTIAANTPDAPQISSLTSGDDKESLHIYPNPASENATISYRLSTESEVNLTVFNYLGEQVKSIRLNSQSKGLNEYKLNLTGLKAGYYLVKLSSNGNTRLMKLEILR